MSADSALREGVSSAASIAAATARATAACGVSGLLLGTAASWQAALIGVQVAVIVGTLAALERPMLRSMAEARE